VYEQDFLDCSYGFRPKRSAHLALEELREVAMQMRGGWVVEVDIKQFFDTLDHQLLMTILRQRIRDGVLLRLVSKWLHAGVLEGTELHRPGLGTPQGGVISPLLANVYLHESSVITPNPAKDRHLKTGQRAGDAGRLFLYAWTSPADKSARWVR
jgi:retron-type reverse transcriptase